MAIARALVNNRAWYWRMNLPVTSMRVTPTALPVAWGIESLAGHRLPGGYSDLQLAKRMSRQLEMRDGRLRRN